MFLVIVWPAVLLGEENRPEEPPGLAPERIIYLGQMSRLRYLDYPYQEDRPGYFRPELVYSLYFPDREQDRLAEEVLPLLPGGAKAWSMTLSGGYGNTSRGIRFAEVALLLRTETLAFSATGLRLLERKAKGQERDFDLYHLHLAPGMGTVPAVTLEFLLGAGLIDAASRSKTGFSLGLHGVLLPGRPLVLDLRTVWDRMGKEDYWELSGGLGAILWRVELRVAYLALLTPTQTAHGPALGLSLWF